MKLKNITEFINESYTVDYLVTIIRKLKSEGKSNEMIYSYLNILNIPNDRIVSAMTTYQSCIKEELSIDEADDTDLEDLVDDVDDDTEKEKPEETPIDGEEETTDGDEDEDDEEKPESELEKTIDDVKTLAKGMKAIKSIIKDKDTTEDEESM